MKKHTHTREPLPYPKDMNWTEALIYQYDTEIARVAKGYGLDTYPNELRVVSDRDLLAAYSTVGMPVMYSHWSFGKRFAGERTQYNAGQMGLAYELVINSNPCVAYLMESNSLMMQALVIAHASYGHNSFFKGNYLFREYTRADGILDYLSFAQKFIDEQYERRGLEKVNRILDAAHALMNFGVFKSRRSKRLSPAEEQERLRKRIEHMEREYDPLFSGFKKEAAEADDRARKHFRETGWLDEPEENILYFIEKNAPLLEDWEREIVRIVRKIAEYFYPQRQTQVMNEGWATFWHYTILNHLYDEGLLADGFMLEFSNSHTAVVYQPAYNSPYYSGINPYTLGFEMFRDIRRIAENPTDEDREWFPYLVNRPWTEVLDEAMRGFKDESFIQQYLSPRLIRKLGLFNIHDSNDEHPEYGEEVLEVTHIHDEFGYKAIRNLLSSQYNLANRLPQIEVVQVDMRNDRSVRLRHKSICGKTLEPDSMVDTLTYLQELWGFVVYLEEEDMETGEISNLYWLGRDE